MRVILATSAPSAGGVLRHLLDLATYMRRDGHEIVIASRPDAGPTREAAAQESFPWVSLNQSLHIRADVRHLHLHNSLDNRALPLLAGWRAAVGSGAIVMTEHLPRTPRTDFTWPSTLLQPGKSRPGAAATKQLMKRAQYWIPDAIIAVSAFSANFMAKRWGVPRSRFVVVHNGVPVPDLPADTGRVPDAPMRVICIGAMHLLKGYDLLLEATAVAVEPWQLVIVGDGPERARLEAKTAALPPGRFVTFAGWQVDPTNAVLGADVLCAPSRYESFSYVIIEAMALARPVVATAVDGAPEAVSDGVTGRLVPAEDPPSLAAALDELARDPKGRIGMGREGRARVAAEFEVTQMVRRTLQLYTQVRERPHAPLAKLRTYASDLSPRRATGDSDQPRNHTEGSVSCARKVSGQGAFVHATRFNPRFARQIPQPRNVSGL